MRRLAAFAAFILTTSITLPALAVSNEKAIVISTEAQGYIKKVNTNLVVNTMKFSMFEEEYKEENPGIIEMDYWRLATETNKRTWSLYESLTSSKNKKLTVKQIKLARIDLIALGFKTVLLQARLSDAPYPTYAR